MHASRPVALRSRLRPALAALATLAALAAAAGVPAAVAATPSPPAPPADLVATGKYLADAAHCGACHTRDAARPFAGNVPIRSSFGTMYASNITPDRATGIGDWTLAEFAAALREGKGKHGEPLYPAMPYTEFTKVSDADVAALWAYFRTVAPVAEKTKPNAMKFPFGIRSGVVAWQALFFRPGRYVPDASQTAEWNRGAYLVQGLGHCAACHSPRTKTMAYRQGRSLEGATGQDWWYAPDISGGRWSGIRDWSVEQVRDFLKTGHNDRNVAAVGPMLQTIAEGTSRLADADLRAMAVYLKNQPPPETDPAPPAPTALAPERREAGALVYAAHCASCHGADGAGADGVAPALAGNSALSGKGVENVARSVLQGFAPQGRWGGMPSFAHALPSRDIADVANWVSTAWGGTAQPPATPSSVDRLRADVEDSIDPAARQALLCPALPVDAIDAAAARDVGALAAKPAAQATVPPGLLAGYRARHPSLERSTAITHLSALYCRQLMTAPGGDLAAKQSRLVAFTARLAQQGARAR
jgi:mono/diheme cytochrome c family protein